MRLTGKHETASIDTFSYGIADRGASIRVPHSFANNGYKGYLADRFANPEDGVLGSDRRQGSSLKPAG